MRNLKKFLALVLAMVMAFSLMVTANASHAGTQYGDEADVTPAFSEAVEVLTGMGVFQGDNGDFRPASNITRAEVAAIIYRLATGDTGTAKMDLYTTRHPFTDVRADAWYAGYVGYLYNAKIIKGTTATTFNPAGNVTGYEVLAMILRAVGYDKNDEFTGSTWTVEVASTATNLGILRDVDSTHYGDTLHLASRRDVVASMLFRTAAYVPMVQYTLAFGYQDTGMEGGVTGSTKNPTLGYKFFGLTGRTGIVVGNQATGESFTRVGFKVELIDRKVGSSSIGVGTRFNDYNVIGVDYGHTTNLLTDDTTTNYASPGTNYLQTNLALDYNFNTGLDFFGHKVNVWYNAKSYTGSETLTSNSTLGSGNDYKLQVPSRFATYAVIDKASLVKTVWANDLTNDDAVAGKTSVYSAAVAAGFSRASAPAFESDRYSRIIADSYNTDNSAFQSRVGMYKIISNNDGKAADVVISLNQEVATISQVNTTIKNGEYIYLDSGNSRFGDNLTGGANQGKILFDQLSDASVKELGTLVTAHQIVGTYNYYVGSVLTEGTYTNRTGLTAKDWLYQTDKLEPSITGTIATYTLAASDDEGDGNRNVTSVTLTDGTVINLSGITGSWEPWAFDTYCHLVNGLTKLVDDSNTAAGVTYTFYMDEVGRFIGVGIPNEYEFLYTTFADYQMGNLGTGTIGYYAYGVDWNGEIVKDKLITRITLPYGTITAGGNGFADPVNNTVTTYTGMVTWPGAGPLSTGYNLLPVTMKNQGNITSGNEIWQGDNTRFVMNPAGHLSYDREGAAKYGTRFIGFDNGQADVKGTANVNDWTWEITSGDVANGFKRVYNATAKAGADQNAYLLTNTTKFIVVTGSGTADLAVKIYNGIGELVGSNTSAEISIGHDATNGNDLVGDNVYFLTNADRYGNVNTSDNATINTVILSDTNLNNFTARSLFFSEPGNTATGVKLAGTNNANINQYKLYNNGQVGYYWVNDALSLDAAGATSANGSAVTGDFYQLTPVATVNGQTIYKAIVKSNQNGAGNYVGSIYDYIVVNNLSTAEITLPVLGSPKQVFSVGGAVVTEAYGTNNGTLATTTNGINSVLELNHAVSMGKGSGGAGDLWNVSVAIEFSGVSVSTIYVTNIQNAP